MNEVRGYTSKTYAESTKATYHTHLKAFLRFCIRFGFTPVPATQVCLLSYIAFLARTLKPTSITGYLNIIRILHLEAGFDNPLELNFAVANLKKGIQRSLGSVPKQMHPITCEMLLAIRKHLSFLCARDIAFWCICMIGFYGFLRKSTLLPITANKPGDSCLLFKDVIWYDNDTFTINIGKTKTIQCHERVLKLPFVSSKSSSLCPVQALKDLLHVSPKDPNQSLFAFNDRNGMQMWTHSSFVTRLRQILSSAGYNASFISCHSFRRGGATFAFALGLSVLDIKKRGDWASDAVYEYIHITDEHYKDVARRLVEGSHRVLLK